jgi:hypothetical protein
MGKWDKTAVGNVCSTFDVRRPAFWKNHSWTEQRFDPKPRELYLDKAEGWIRQRMRYLDRQFQGT